MLSVSIFHFRLFSSFLLLTSLHLPAALFGSAPSLLSMYIQLYLFLAPCSVPHTLSVPRFLLSFSYFCGPCLMYLSVPQPLLYPATTSLSPISLSPLYFSIHLVSLLRSLFPSSLSLLRSPSLSSLSRLSIFPHCAFANDQIERTWRTSGSAITAKRARKKKRRWKREERGKKRERKGREWERQAKVKSG